MESTERTEMLMYGLRAVGNTLPIWTREASSSQVKESLHTLLLVGFRDVGILMNMPFVDTL